MASSQKTQNIDVLNVKTILARGENNTTIPANSVLTTDGQGGTVWIEGQALRSGLAFDKISTSNKLYTAGANPSTVFTILNGPNAGLLSTSTNNTVKLYATAFSQVNVGQSTLYAFDSTTNNFTSTLTIAGAGDINVTSDSNTNSVYIRNVNNFPSTLSTLIKNVSTVNSVISYNISTFNSPYLGQPFIQYGFTTSDISGEKTISIVVPYITDYAVQLTYYNNPYNSNYTSITPLSFKVDNSSTFTVYGTPSWQFNWTTYGSIPGIPGAGVQGGPV